jgi:hypothetical protein
MSLEEVNKGNHAVAATPNMTGKWRRPPASSGFGAMECLVQAEVGPPHSPPKRPCARVGTEETCAAAPQPRWNHHTLCCRALLLRPPLLLRVLPGAPPPPGQGRRAGRRSGSMAARDHGFLHLRLFEKFKF